MMVSILKTIYIIPAIIIIAVFKLITGGPVNLLDYADHISYITNCECRHCQKEAKKVIRKFFLFSTVIYIILYILLR